MKVSDLKALPPKVLIYAPAGRGKTALALTLGERCCYIDMDGNIDVAFGLHDNLRAERLAVDLHQFLEEDPVHKAVAFARAKKFIYGIADDCVKGKFLFDAVVLDSLTSLAVSSQHATMTNSGKPGVNPEIQHWGLLLNEIENVVTAFRALPVRGFMLAHQMEYTDEDKTVVQIAISGQKLPGKITRLFSEIWYLRIKEVGEKKREIYIQTVPTASITCRSGRGLQSGLVIGTIDKNDKPGVSMGLWDIIKKLEAERELAVVAPVAPMIPAAKEPLPISS